MNSSMEAWSPVRCLGSAAICGMDATEDTLTEVGSSLYKLTPKHGGVDAKEKVKSPAGSLGRDLVLDQTLKKSIFDKRITICISVVLIFLLIIHTIQEESDRELF